MEPGSIVETLDEGEDIMLGLCAGLVLAMMDALGPESVEEALHRGIVGMRYDDELDVDWSDSS
ncbi:hypothetical protein ACVI1I_006440 [Bradyrhizobium sp. USDA 4459]